MQSQLRNSRLWHALRVSYRVWCCEIAVANFTPLWLNWERSVVFSRSSAADVKQCCQLPALRANRIFVRVYILYVRTISCTRARAMFQLMTAVLGCCFGWTEILQRQWIIHVDAWSGITKNQLSSVECRTQTPGLHQSQVLDDVPLVDSNVSVRSGLHTYSVGVDSLDWTPLTATSTVRTLNPCCCWMQVGTYLLTGM